jgi:hypothetical protein
MADEVEAISIVLSETIKTSEKKEENANETGKKESD